MWLNNFTCYGCLPALLAAGHFVLPGTAIVYRRLISEVAWPIITKLCHVFYGDPDL